MATWISRSVNLTLAGDRQQISTSDFPVLAITFLANDDNTGTLYVGDDTVDKDALDGPGAGPLLPGRKQNVRPADILQANGVPHTVSLATFYLDGTVTDDKLVYFALLDI